MPDENNAPVGAGGQAQKGGSAGSRVNPQAAYSQPPQPHGHAQPEEESPKSDLLPNDTMPEDVSKGEKDKDLYAERPEEKLGAKPPDHAYEPLEGEIVEKIPRQHPESEPVEKLPDKRAASDEFKKMVKHAGISKKTCFLFLSVVALVAVCVVYFVFYRGASGTGDQESESVGVEKMAHEEFYSEYGITSGVNYGLSTQSADTGRQISSVRVFYSGIDTALIFGEVKKYPFVDLVKYIKTLQSLRNVYKTDIRAMLDASSARLEVLEAHIKIFEETLGEARKEYEDMVAKMSEMKDLYDKVVLSKSDFENKFFESVSDLDPENSYNYLEQFIVKYKEQVDSKSRYNAMAKLGEYYQNAFARADARLADIKANIEPLVAGIKVMDIVGSDIDLIEPEGADR